MTLNDTLLLLFTVPMLFVVIPALLALELLMILGVSPASGETTILTKGKACVRRLAEFPIL